MSGRGTKPTNPYRRLGGMPAAGPLSPWPSGPRQFDPSARTPLGLLPVDDEWDVGGVLPLARHKATGRTVGPVWPELALEPVRSLLGLMQAAGEPAKADPAQVGVDLATVMGGGAGVEAAMGARAMPGVLGSGPGALERWRAAQAPDATSNRRTKSRTTAYGARKYSGGPVRSRLDEALVKLADRKMTVAKWFQELGNAGVRKEEITDALTYAPLPKDKVMTAAELADHIEQNRVQLREGDYLPSNVAADEGLYSADPDSIDAPYFDDPDFDDDTGIYRLEDRNTGSEYNLLPVYEDGRPAAWSAADELDKRLKDYMAERGVAPGQSIQPQPFLPGMETAGRAPTPPRPYEVLPLDPENAEVGQWNWQPPPARGTSWQDPGKSDDPYAVLGLGDENEALAALQHFERENRDISHFIVVDDAGNPVKHGNGEDWIIDNNDIAYAKDTLADEIHTKEVEWAKEQAQEEGYLGDTKYEGYINTDMQLLEDSDRYSETVWQGFNAPSDKEYATSHFQEGKNNLASALFGEVTGIDQHGDPLASSARLHNEGGRFYSPEEDAEPGRWLLETQSDRHQKGLHEGYRRELTPDEAVQLNAMDTEIAQLRKQYQEPYIQQRDILSDQLDAQKKIAQEIILAHGGRHNDVITMSRIRAWTQSMDSLPDDLMPQEKRAELLSAVNEYERVNNARNALMDRWDQSPEMSRISDLSDKARKLRNLPLSGVPDAPFKSGWKRLALIRGLRDAVDDNTDLLVSTGNTVARRWSKTPRTDVPVTVFRAEDDQITQNLFKHLPEKFTEGLKKGGFTHILNNGSNHYFFNPDKKTIVEWRGGDEVKAKPLTQFMPPDDIEYLMEELGKSPTKSLDKPKKLEFGPQTFYHQQYDHEMDTALRDLLEGAPVTRWREKINGVEVWRYRLSDEAKEKVRKGLYLRADGDPGLGLAAAMGDEGEEDRHVRAGRVPPSVLDWRPGNEDSGAPEPFRLDSGEWWEPPPPSAMQPRPPPGVRW